ncbi:MAG: methyltransferase family protein [Fimbriimonas sp.]
MPIVRTKHALAYGWLSAAFAAWWIFMLAAPAQVRAIFVGSSLARDHYLWLLPADLVVIVSAFAEWRSATGNRARGSLVTVAVLVGAGCSLWLAVTEPESVLGFFLMMPAATLAVAMEVTRRGIPILWGPFRFKKSEPESEKRLRQKVLVQTAVMWGVFLAGIPAALVQIEARLGWQILSGDPDWLRLAWVVPMLGLGAFATRASRHMVALGEGTPLPTQGTRKLVIGGIYGHIRNPMALGSIGQCVCIGLILPSALTVSYTICGAILWDFCVRPLEEAYLESEFGDAYVRYRNAVPCWRFRPNAYRDYTHSLVEAG